MRQSVSRRIREALALVLICTSVGWAAGTPAPEKKAKSTIYDDLAFAVVAKSADPYAIQTDFVMGDELATNLRTLKRLWEKKPISKEEMVEAGGAAKYVQGVFQGFMIGISAESYRQKMKDAPLGAPICTGEKANLQAIVNAALKGLEKWPAEKLHEQTASNLIIPAFLEEHLYDKCLKP